MGVSGLWEELLPSSERICPLPSFPQLILALTMLATDTFQQQSRPLRVAIDTSIWSFQVQNSTDQGSNPSLRTFYYRLCRLLHTNVQPLFVFDGPKKPPFKRNQRTQQFYGGNSLEDQLMKRMIKSFGFRYWDAPGEAEAECALLQTMGIVDLVITEDVDCIMFGATKVAREISEGKHRSHVDLYMEVERRAGLDRDGLVLIAMMSGGDYLPAGVQGCGPKIAAEIARAGYGRDLMRTTDYNSWREELATSLTLNPTKQFSRKQPALAQRILNSTFPDTTILKYYASPVVSSEAKIKEFVPKWGKPDVGAIADMCKELFMWDSRWGMGRFMRSFSPAYLVWMMVHEPELFVERGNMKSMTTGVEKSATTRERKGKVKGGGNSENKTMTDFFKTTKSTIPSKLDPPSKSANPSSSPIKSTTSKTPHPPDSPYILDIHSTRSHFSTDSTPELRLSYIPSIVIPYAPLNFNLAILHTDFPASTETPTLSPTKSHSLTNPLSPSKRHISPPSSKSSESDHDLEVEDEAADQEGTQRRESRWSPDDIDRIWIPEVYVRRAIPEQVKLFEEKVEARKSPKKTKATGVGKEKGKGKGGMSVGAMERFIVKRTTTAMTGTARGTGEGRSEMDGSLRSVRKENLASPAMRKLDPFSSAQRDTSPISLQSQQSPSKFEIPLSMEIPLIFTTPKKPTRTRLAQTPISPSSTSRHTNRISSNRPPPPPSINPTTPTTKATRYVTPEAKSVNILPRDLEREWDILESSDSDESLPSPSDLIRFLTPRTETTEKIRKVGANSPLASKGKAAGGKEGLVKETGRMAKGLGRLKETDASVTDEGRGRGKVIGGFRESLGGTLYEIDGD